MSDPSCRAFRELLGVYVVGAIEPGERAALDSHLSQCYECREELAGLASLPAFLHRVPLADAERLALSDGDGQEGPPAELLDALLKRVGAKRRSRRLRTAFATAAAILIAVGGAAAATEALSPAAPAPHSFVDVASASRAGVAVTVQYAKTAGGTSMSVKARGLRQRTHCQFYVVTTDGQRVLAGEWITGPGASGTWYPASSRVPLSSVRGFVLKSAGRTLVQIPAS